MGPLIYFLISHMQFWAAAVIAYFCGCFNGAVIVSKYILRDDVRNHGSGNAGLTNFFRTFGGPLTFVVILCDVLKAVAAIKISVWLGGYFDPRIMPDTPMENQAGEAFSACWATCSLVCSTLREARASFPAAPLRL